MRRLLILALSRGTERSFHGPIVSERFRGVGMRFRLGPPVIECQPRGSLRA
jgi:hypothetical protein